MNNQHFIKLPDFLAVIFDMDGLVLDTEMTYCKAWQKASAEMGCQFTEAFCLSMSGLHSQDVNQRLLDFCVRGFDVTHFYHLSGRYWREHVEQHGIPVKKGFFDLLDVLNVRETPFCLATNSRMENALECLQLANMKGVFSNIVARDHVELGKPSPDIFLLAAKLLNVPILKCLVLEDSHTGIQAAVNAGAPSVFIPSVVPFELKTANLSEYVLNDLAELAQLIEQI